MSGAPPALPKGKAKCIDKSIDAGAESHADTLTELGRRADQAHRLSTDISFSSQSLVSATAPELALSPPRSSDTITVPFKPTHRVHDYLGGVIYGIDHPRTISTMNSSQGIALCSPTSRPVACLTHTSCRHAYDRVTDQDIAPRRSRSRRVRFPVMPQLRMRDCTKDLRAHKQRRHVAGRPEAMELARPPAEGTTEEPITLVDSVANEPIEVGRVRYSSFRSICPPCAYTQTELLSCSYGCLVCVISYVFLCNLS